MKKTLLLLVALFSVSALAQQQGGAGLSSSDLANITAMATATANGTMSHTATVDASGNLVTNADGSAKLAPNSTSQVQSQQTLFQSVSGVSSTYQVTADPGSSSGSAGASVAASTYVDMNCGTPNAQASTSGVLLQLASCNTSGGSVSSVKLNLCYDGLQGGACDKTSSASYKSLTASTNGWTPIPSGFLGVSCNTSGICRVTINRQLTGGGNAATMTSQAQAQTFAAGSNSAVASIQTAATAQTTDQVALAESQQQCLLQNNARLAAGQTPLSCDGTQQVTGANSLTTSNGQNSAALQNCQDTYSCIRQATTTSTYAQTCSRDFPLTEYDCQVQTPTLTCSVTVDSTGKQTNSCTPDQLTDAQKVTSTQTTDATSWTDSYILPKQAAQQGQCTVYPYPLNGPASTSCANNGVGTPQGCSDGGWFGRTLSDSECTVVSQAAQADGSISQVIDQLDYTQKSGCGYCVMQSTAATCQAQPATSGQNESCGAIPSNCTLVSATPKSSINGITTSQDETYQCTSTQTSCAQWQDNNNCPVDLAHGTDSAASISTNDSGNFNSAIGSAAVLDAIQQGANANTSLTLPKIFNGTDARCREPVGFLSGVLLNDCCNQSLQRTGGSKLMDGCSMDEVTLAASRRANEAVYIGNYCSKKIGFGPFKKCVENTQTYCTYEGLLPMTIQTQGRQQLANLVASGFGASEQSQTLNFPYYNANGGWGNPLTLNGVTIVPWQYPQYCSDPAQATQSLQNPNAVPCPPVLEQWFATCSNPAGCGDLPFSPELGSPKWSLQMLDPLSDQSAAISNYAAATGACDPTTSQCQYKISAWPAGVGGRAMLSRSITFPLYATGSASTSNTFSLGDELFRAQLVAGTSNTTTLPASLVMQASSDYGQTWQNVTLPTKTVDNSAVLPGTDITLTGSCTAASSTCSYTATGTVAATAKPWGSAQNPDCTGFTAAQISTMDFSKMDFSQWLASVMNNVQAPDASQVSQMVTQDAATFYNSSANGSVEVTMNAPSRVQYAYLSPAQGLGPYSTRLVVSADYAQASGSTTPDPITAVSVDWGDCSTQDTASLTQDTQSNGSGALETLQAYEAGHTYLSPDQLACNAVSGKSVTLSVKLKITSKSGVHYTSLTAQDIWANKQDPVGLNESAGGSAGGSIKAQVSTGASQ